MRCRKCSTQCPAGAVPLHCWRSVSYCSRERQLSTVRRAVTCRRACRWWLSRRRAAAEGWERCGRAALSAAATCSAALSPPQNSDTCNSGLLSVKHQNATHALPLVTPSRPAQGPPVRSRRSRDGPLWVCYAVHTKPVTFVTEGAPCGPRYTPRLPVGGFVAGRPETPSSTQQASPSVSMHALIVAGSTDSPK